MIFTRCIGQAAAVSHGRNRSCIMMIAMWPVHGQCGYYPPICVSPGRMRAIIPQSATANHCSVLTILCNNPIPTSASDTTTKISTNNIANQCNLRHTKFCLPVIARYGYMDHIMDNPRFQMRATDGFLARISACCSIQSSQVFLWQLITHDYNMRNHEIPMQCMDWTISCKEQF